MTNFTKICGATFVLAISSVSAYQEGYNAYSQNPNATVYSPAPSVYSNTGGYADRGYMNQGYGYADRSMERNDYMDRGMDRGMNEMNRGYDNRNMGNMYRDDAMRNDRMNNERMDSERMQNDRMNSDRMNDRSGDREEGRHPKFAFGDTTEQMNQLANQDATTQMDNIIIKRVRHRIGQDSALAQAASNIQVTSVNADVTLNGSVSTLVEKNKIEKIAKDAPGVKSVTNNLTVANARATTSITR